MILVGWTWVKPLPVSNTGTASGKSTYNVLLSSGIIFDRPRFADIRRRISAGIEQFACNPAAAHHPVAVNDFCNAVAAEVVTFIGSKTEGSADPRIMGGHRLRLFRRTRARIHERLAHGIDIGDLCATVGTSRRALEYVFRATEGVSPFRYIRAVQLNQIRRELLRHDTAQQPLADLA